MDEKLLDEILKDYRNELNELKEIRRERAERHSQMTEEELIEDLTKSYEEVYKDAIEQGFTVGLMPVEDEDKNK